MYIQTTYNATILLNIFWYVVLLDDGLFWPKHVVTKLILSRPITNIRLRYD